MHGKPKPLFTLLVLLPAIITSTLWADQEAPQSTGDSSSAPAAKPPLTKEEIDQVVAPIALHPDSLLSQILMASTYPLEIVQADRWVKGNKELSNDQLAKALNDQQWDASVKSLTGFPDVLAMMSEKLDWTIKLGDAFLGQQKDVMDAVQRLRAKASEEGNLQSNEQQNVQVTQEGDTQVIVIESSDPEVVYVPQYDPVVVYGSWPYPSYPPYYYYPPGYVAGTALVSFGVGLACGAAWGWAWGNCDWGHSDVDIDIDRNTEFNRNIDRTSIKNELNSKGLGEGKGNWQHDGDHRRGVSYRDNETASKYGRGSDSRASQSREQYRGRAESGQRDIARSGADSARRPSTSDRSAGASQRDTSRGASASSRDRSSSSGSGSAFSGSNRSSSSTRAASSRGSSSRGSAGSRGGGGRGGGGRGGGRR